MAWVQPWLDFIGQAERLRESLINTGIKRESEVLFERTSSAWDSAPSRETGQGVAALTQSGVGTCGADDNQAQAGHLIAYGLQTANSNMQGPIHKEEQAWTVQPHPSQTRTAVVVCQNGSDVQVSDKPGALTAGQARQTSGDLVAYNWQSGGDVRLSFGKPSLHCGQVPAVGVRRLTPTECERLQGFPEIEKYVIMDVCLDHQKNYVNVEIRSRKSPRLAGNAGKIELLESAKSAARSSYTKNQPTDKPVPLIVDINCGERIVSIHSQERLLWYANIAEEKSKSPLPMLIVDFVRLLVGLVSTVERIILNGKVESQANVRLLTPLQNGTRHVRISGNEITQLVKDAVIDLTTNKKLLKSIISGPSDMKNIEHNLTTSCSYVLSVITGYILPETLNTSSFRIRITTRLGWTAVNGMSDSARYRMLGNAVAVPVARWLGERITRIDARSTK